MSVEEPKSLDAALLIFQADPPILVKDKKGQAGNQPTKYADLVQVNRVVLARLNKLGVIFVGKPTVLEDGSFVLDYRLTHVPSGESETGRYPLAKSDNPQRMGSQISYSRRYVINALTGVAAEDEDDDGTGTRRAQRATQPRTRPPEGKDSDQGGSTAQRSSQRATPPLPSETGPILPGQRGKIVTGFEASGITDRTERLTITSGIVGRDLGSVNDLTRYEAQGMIETLDLAAASADPAAYLRQYLPDDPLVSDHELRTGHRPSTEGQQTP